MIFPYRYFGFFFQIPWFFQVWKMHFSWFSRPLGTLYKLFNCLDRFKLGVSIIQTMVFTNITHIRSYVSPVGYPSTVCCLILWNGFLEITLKLLYTSVHIWNVAIKSNVKCLDPGHEGIESFHLGNGQYLSQLVQTNWHFMGKGEIKGQVHQKGH